MGRKFLNKKKIEKLEMIPIDENSVLPTRKSSDEIIPKREKWVNKQRVLIFAARGISHRDRYLMRDIRSLMPHHRPEAKMERSKTLSIVNEMCIMKHCNKAILFEGRRKHDLYMWLSNLPKGPSVKFLVENLHTMAELKMTGNCLRGSRPLLSFDAQFDIVPHLKLLKEILTQVFAVPNHHPKSQPFIDHVYTFAYLDKRIWFRNFQILSEDGGLAEVGPRFVMNPIKIFEGSFTGNSIWENRDYVSPSQQRQTIKKMAKDKYVKRIEQKVHRIVTQPRSAYDDINADEIFRHPDIMETAEILAEKEEKQSAQPAKKKSTKIALTKKINDKQLKAAIEVIEKKKQKAKEMKTKSVR